MITGKKIFREKAAKSAVYGGIIAVSAIIIATLASAYFNLGSITPSTIIEIQKTNVALWILDVLPFAYMLWGQNLGTVIIEEADSMIAEKTDAMRHETQELRDKFKHDNLHDPLTQLPNLGKFIEHVDQSILSSAHTKDPGSFIQTLSGYITREHHSPSDIAVFLIDIANFKEINNTLGSQNGDELLKHISQRLLSSFTKPDEFIARIGGDDFALVIANTNESRAVKINSHLKSIFKKSFDIQGVSLILETSVGVCLYPQHGDTAKELLQHAEIAMYACKKANKDHVFYNQDLNDHNINDLILKAEINRAFDNDELVLYYQPKVNTKNQVNEVEALVRWLHPSNGLISPDTFIPIIIQKRLNKELLEKILILALIQAEEWKKQGIHLRIAINLTSFDLLDPLLPEMVLEKLAHYNLSPDVLKFEITETTLIENQALTLKTLKKIETMGIPTSIDDFGTGYSSLSYLSSLPISEVKIDRSFVVEIMENERNVKIVRAIIALAHSLSLTTVAEGVEDAETMAGLRKLKCDVIQGYYISKPLDGKTFTKWIVAWKEKRNRTATKSK